MTSRERILVEQVPADAVCKGDQILTRHGILSVSGVRDVDPHIAPPFSMIDLGAYPPLKAVGAFYRVVPSPSEPDDYEQRIQQRFSEATDAFTEVFYRAEPQDAVRPLTDALMAFLAVLERHPLVTAETVICSDCMKDASPLCEMAGHGLDPLVALIESNANGAEA
jgi:hypothetical protein